MNRCGHTEPELSCLICASRDDLIEKVAELRAVVKNLAEPEEGLFVDEDGNGDLLSDRQKVNVLITYAKQHAIEE